MGTCHSFRIGQDDARRDRGRVGVAVRAWAPEFVFALAWLVFVLSLGAFFLLFLLIRRGAATRVASLMYLTPPCAALLAWWLFGETFTLVSAAGMALAVIAVRRVTHEAVI
jgi:drug/metabolite transporter (DMT)-like permease